MPLVCCKTNVRWTPNCTGKLFFRLPWSLDKYGHHINVSGIFYPLRIQIAYDREFWCKTLEPQVLPQFK